MASLNELSDEDREPRGEGWRRLPEPVVVRGYVAQGWHDVVAVNLNEDTRELRVEWPPREPGDKPAQVTHRVLSADHYQAPPGTLDAGSPATS